MRLQEQRTYVRYPNHIELQIGIGHFQWTYEIPRPLGHDGGLALDIIEQALMGSRPESRLFECSRCSEIGPGFVEAIGDRVYTTHETCGHVTSRPMESEVDEDRECPECGVSGSGCIMQSGETIIVKFDACGHSYTAPLSEMEDILVGQ